MVEIKKGTTTIGIITKNAAIIGAETKSTMGFLVASKTAEKIHKIDDHIGITIAGSVGDAQALIRLLRAQLKLYKLDRGPITVKAATTLLSNVLQGSKYFPYYNQLIIAGYDSKPRLYSLDPVGGFDGTDNFYSTGSGSPFAYGVLETKYRENMSEEEGIELIVKAISAAIERDIGSGGKNIEIAVIDDKGYRKIPQSEVKKFL